MAWVILLVAGLFEVAWAVGLKYAAGFTRLWPSVFTAVSLVLSMGLLGLALRGLPLFREPATVARLACIGLIVAGIVGLKLVTPR